jgi:hypothetical protein
VIASNTLNTKEILKIIKRNTRHIQMSDMSITVIYHAMSLTVLYQLPFFAQAEIFGKHMMEMNL